MSLTFRNGNVDNRRTKPGASSIISHIRVSIIIITKDFIPELSKSPLSNFISGFKCVRKFFTVNLRKARLFDLGRLWNTRAVTESCCWNVTSSSSLLSEARLSLVNKLNKEIIIWLHPSLKPERWAFSFGHIYRGHLRLIPRVFLPLSSLDYTATRPRPARASPRKNKFQWERKQKTKSDSETLRSARRSRRVVAEDV